MKITCLLFILSVGSVFATNIQAQEAKLSITGTKIKVAELIEAIEKETGYLFVYNEDEVDTDRIITVDYKHEELKGILHDVFDPVEIEFAIEGTGIMLKKSKYTVSTSSDNVSEVQSDKITVKGGVKDEEGFPVIGATVMQQGSQNIGTITDVDGNYTLEVSKSATLVFSCIGYHRQTISVGGQTAIDVILQEDLQDLEEVVVVGFGTQRKINLTGSVGSIKVRESLESRSVTNVQELLAGSVPGLLITKGSGAVGSAASINLRGTATIGGSSGVLILIDGIPGNINTLNPNDIEEISVLKDAASAAIYGARAANGVILITTKSPAKMGRPVVEVGSSIGIQNPQHRLDFVGSADFMKLYDQAMINDGKEAVYGQKGLDDLKNGLYPDNKWYKEVYRKNTVINNNYVAFSGSEKSINYRMSVSNDNQQGAIPNNEYNRLIIKPNLTLKLAKNLEVQANLQYTQTTIKEPQGGTTIAQSQSARISPVTKIKEDNGLYAVGSAMVGNPIAGIQEGGFVKNKYKEFLSVFDVRYSPINDLNLRGNVSYYTFDRRALSRLFTYNLYDAEGGITKTVNPINSARNDSESNYTLQLQFIADYAKSFAGGHNFKALGGYSQEYRKNESFWGSRQDLPFDNVHVIETGSSNEKNGGAATHVAMQSMFGRVNYDYQSRYLFEANVRADGSSRFSKGHRWGVFPSFSAGWNVHIEEFMSNVTWLSQLKLRASWGELGDSEKSLIGYHPTATVINYNPKMYTFGGKLVPGAYNNKSINPLLSWETSQMTNIGFDLGVLNQRINLTVEYFINTRKDILYSPPAPTEFGLSAPYDNLLKMRNQGFEFLVSYNDRKGDFSWGADFNLSFSKNKVLEMGDNDMWLEGNSVTYLNDRYQLAYGYEAIGLFQSEEEIEQSATQGAVRPGNIKFKDQDGDGKIDGDDRVVLNRKVPVNFGGNIRLGYRDFDFSANFYGRLNTMNYLQGYEGWAFYLTENARPLHKDSWTPENPNASYPRLTLVNTSNDTQYSSYWLRKSNYLKLQNIQFGYTLPKPALDKIKLQYLRVYLTGQNIATITGYDGFDPEGGWYPLLRTFSLGFNLKF